MNIINFLENLSQEEIEIVGTQGQIAILENNETIAYFDSIEEAQDYIDNLQE